MATGVALPGPLLAQLAAVGRWRPSRPIAGERAALFLAEQPMTRIGSPWGDPGREGLRGQTLAAFDDFVENGRPPRGLFKETWGRTAIAQLEVLAPRPGVRLFGGFVDPACFVGLRLFHRDELPYKPTGQRGAIDYKTLGEALVREWAMLLPGVARVRIGDL